MACAYTTRKKDRESGAAEAAGEVGALLTANVAAQLAAADEDAAAYAALQSTWKADSGKSAEEKAAIEATALAVPTRVVERCHASAAALADFMPCCSPNIVSDAKVGLGRIVTLYCRPSTSYHISYTIRYLYF